MQFLCHGLRIEVDAHTLYLPNIVLQYFATFLDAHTNGILLISKCPDSIMHNLVRDVLFHNFTNH